MKLINFGKKQSLAVINLPPCPEAEAYIIQERDKVHKIRFVQSNIILTTLGQVLPKVNG